MGRRGVDKPWLHWLQGLIRQPVHHRQPQLLEAPDIPILGGDRHNQPLTAEHQFTNLTQGFVQFSFMLQVVGGHLFQMQVRVHAMNIFVVLAGLAEVGKGPG